MPRHTDTVNPQRQHRGSPFCHRTCRCPVDDGAASHLTGQPLPQLAFDSTDGTVVDLPASAADELSSTSIR
ncbi:hypothetical protein A5780_25960 [Nocardia sp. 852002-20019_SCH5090214]|nr:hypothetical protein A5780_25960 [Nocardia sp. 852002-20019_SCH5090214]